MRKPIIAANWKLQMAPSETTDFLGHFLRLAGDRSPIDIVVAPPFVSLKAAADLISEKETIKLAAQNMSEHQSGAYTGEISSIMLKELFVSYVILGHSERRAIFGEEDAVINAKVRAAHDARLRPILCIGETIEERKADKVEQVLGTQLRGGMEGLDDRQASDTVIAYEPVWAIGTGETASPEQAQDAHAFIRKTLTELYSEDIAARIRIQYGGSVKPNNIADLISQEDIDGALVGGASLDHGSFYEICKGAIEHVSED